MSKNERQEVLRALDAWDRSVFREVTSYQSPLLDRALPALTTAADRSVIWLVVAAGLAATGRRRQRRAAVRGVSSVAVTSLLVNQLAKRVVPRPRPVTPVCQIGDHSAGCQGRHRFLQAMRRPPQRLRSVPLSSCRHWP